MKAAVREIFSSVQGEGPYVGTRQIFIRFDGCNLSCRYCDTARSG
ncbi:MAG: 7-carboxy-7-deazaguanine synthase QueE, partial [Actinobacteria bacterium]|nr:7-carboxy-7-deazaguanine synthase QueE [Actinomycetota bacterium]